MTPERCARCAEIQDEVLQAARRANNTAAFFANLKRATIKAEERADAAELRASETMENAVIVIDALMKPDSKG